MDEGKTNKNRQDPARKIPIPEARMRLQETSKFSTSLEANITRPAIVREKSPMDRRVSPKRPAGTISNNLANQRAKNPFDDDDGYDEAKNPFAEDGDDGTDTDRKKNQSEEYDNNLNPFA